MGAAAGHWQIEDIIGLIQASTPVSAFVKATAYAKVLNTYPVQQAGRKAEDGFTTSAKFTMTPTNIVMRLAVQAALVMGVGLNPRLPCGVIGKAWVAY